MARWSPPGRCGQIAAPRPRCRPRPSPPACRRWCRRRRAGRARTPSRASVSLTSRSRRPPPRPKRAGPARHRRRRPRGPGRTRPRRRARAGRAGASRPSARAPSGGCRGSRGPARRRATTALSTTAELIAASARSGPKASASTAARICLPSPSPARRGHEPRRRVDGAVGAPVRPLEPLDADDVAGRRGRRRAAPSRRATTCRARASSPARGRRDGWRGRRGRHTVVACGFISRSSGSSAHEDRQVGLGHDPQVEVGRAQADAVQRPDLAVHGRRPASERVAQRPQAAQGRGLAEDLHRLEERRRDARARDGRAQRAEGEARLDAEPVDDRGAQRLLDARRRSRRCPCRARRGRGRRCRRAP